MKITRDIFDNDKKIIHITYTKKEVKEAIKNAEQNMKKMSEDTIHLFNGAEDEISSSVD